MDAENNPGHSAAREAEQKHMIRNKEKRKHTGRR